MSGHSVNISIKKLNKAFPMYEKKEEFLAVNNVSLEIEAGELITLLGPSGCGKTTMLRMIAGFEIPTSGSISFSGKEISTLPPNKRNVGMMFQSYALFPHLSVYDNVAYGLRIQKDTSIQKKVDDILNLMHISEFSNRMPNQISGGQQQRVALARAVVTEPSVLLFDEPLSNLDAKLREYMREELRKIQQRVGITSIYVTHDQAEAMAISDRVVIMKDGIIEQQGSAKNIYTDPCNSFVADFMGKANFVKVENMVYNNGHAEAKILGKIMKLKAATNTAANAVCMVRPEAVRFDPEGIFTATVLNSAYFGNMIEYKLEVAGEILYMTDFSQKFEVYDNGMNVQISLDMDMLRILPDNRNGSTLKIE